MSTPLFSVVVPTCRRNDLLTRCLGRLRPEVQGLSPETYEVIVTDDDPARGARAVVQEFPHFQYAEGPCRGPGSNRNSGTRHARGEWLALTDDDCIPDPGWLQAYQQAIATHPSQRLFEGRIYADRPRASLAEIAPVNETGGYLWSSNLAVQRALFERLRGFDERFRVAMEDVDFRYRLEKAGHKAIFVPAASVCHPWREQRRATDGWKQLSGYSEDTVRFIALHPEQGRELTAKYFLRGVARNLLKRTVPEAVRFRGRGLRTALSNHLSELRLAWEIFRGAPERMRADLQTAVPPASR